MLHNDSKTTQYVRWRAAIIPNQHNLIYEGKIIAANENTLIMLSNTAFRPGCEARFMLEVHEYNGANSTKQTLDLNGKIIENALIGHISLFRHHIQVQSIQHDQLQLLKRLTSISRA